VGTDPSDRQRPVRMWPLDDPAIAGLPGDALVLGADGNDITAARLRASATTTTSDRSDPTDLTETAAAPADGHDHQGDHTQVALWVAAVVLVLAGWWVVSRRADSRKQVRRPGGDP